MFLNRVVVQEEAVAADGVVTRELSVNPLSVILINLRPLNDTGTTVDFQSYLGICASINRLAVLHRGESIQVGRGEDFAAMNYFRRGVMPFQGMHSRTNNERRSVVLPIFMGKFPGDTSSCFPSAPRGDLVIELDFDLADTGYDTLRFSIETIELPGAKPKEYEKITSFGMTNSATGEFYQQMPCAGNMIRGVLLWGTTAFSGATPAPSWGRVGTLLDNQEIGFAATDWETLQSMHCLWGRQPPMYDGHDHGTTVDGNAQTDVTSIGGPYNIGTTGWQNYAFLDYDITRDDMHSLDTKGKSSFQIRGNAETADAVRSMPIEVIKI